MNLQRLKDIVDNAYMSCAHPRITEVKVLAGEDNEVLDIFDIKSSGDILYLDTNVDLESLNGSVNQSSHISYIHILANMLYFTNGDAVDMMLVNEFGDYLVHNHLSLLDGISITLCVSRSEAERYLYNAVEDFYIENSKVYTSLDIDDLKVKYELPKGIYNALYEFMQRLK